MISNELLTMNKIVAKVEEYKSLRDQFFYQRNYALSGKHYYYSEQVRRENDEFIQKDFQEKFEKEQYRILDELRDLIR